MTQVVEANWLAFVLALAIGLLIAWWLFKRASTSQVRPNRPDVLDEGAAPAARNQALIDAPSAVGAAAAPIIVPPPMSVGMAGIGEAVAVAAQDTVEDNAARRPAAANEGDIADDLLRIKGVGPKLVALLGSLGVRHFAQIAAWDDAEIDRIDAQLGTFAGRIRRDNWVEQARCLYEGDVEGFEDKFGKL